MLPLILMLAVLLLPPVWVWLVTFPVPTITTEAELLLSSWLDVLLLPVPIWEPVKVLPVPAWVLLK